MQKIKNWEELSKVPANDRYKIDVDLKFGSAWILPIEETDETKDEYFEHHKYLSTHSFYKNEYEYTSRLLQQFGFNLELENWDNEEK